MDPREFPTKGNLILAKNSLALSLQGFDLMDKKRNILIREMMNHFSPVFLFAVLFPALPSLCREPCFLLYPLSYSDTSGNLFFHPKIKCLLFIR